MKLQIVVRVQYVVISIVPLTRETAGRWLNRARFAYRFDPTSWTFPPRNKVHPQQHRDVERGGRQGRREHRERVQDVRGGRAARQARARQRLHGTAQGTDHDPLGTQWSREDHPYVRRSVAVPNWYSTRVHASWKDCESLGLTLSTADHVTFR